MNNDQTNLLDQVRKQDDKDSVAPINDSPSAPSAYKKSYPPQSDQHHLPQPQHQHPNNQHDQPSHPQQTPAAVTSQSSSSTFSSSVVPPPFSSSSSSLSSSSLPRGDGVTILDGANKELKGVIGQIVKGPFKYDDSNKPNKEWYQVFVLDGTFHDEVQGVDRKPGHLCILPAASLIQKTSTNSYADKRSGKCDQCQRNHTTDCLKRTDVIHEASMLVNNTSTLGLPRIREVLFLCSRCATNKLMSPKPFKSKSTSSKKSSKKATHEVAKTPPNWEVGQIWLGVHVDLIKVIIEAGGDVNQAQTTKGCTPLFMASQKGHTDIVAILLGAPGIQINQHDNQNITPLNTASDYGHTDIVRLLLQQPNIDLNKQDKWNDSALDCATKKKHTEIIQLLTNAGAK